jgi:formylglycine-generating enzyme required for sulfatase activity
MNLEEIKIEYNQKGRTRVIRGGSWGSVASFARAARRVGFDSGTPVFRLYCDGFRLFRLES